MLHDTSIESKPHDAFESEGRAIDIALRLSSKLNDPCLGFTFGRGQLRSDIIIGAQDDVKISNRHFRIYVNVSGILVIEDSSTHGTSVDSPSDLEHSMRFVVSIPSRDRVGDRWEKKLQVYIDHIYQTRHEQAVIARSSQKSAITIALPSMGVNGRQDSRLNVKPSLALIGERETNSRGKEWSGGENYNMLDFLGQGGFARVYKVATKSGGNVFAVKQIDKRRHLVNGILNPKIKDEIHIMKGLDHVSGVDKGTRTRLNYFVQPHIVKLFRYEETPQYLCLILEFVPLGDLGTSISSGCALPESSCQRMAWQIGCALDCLHKRKIMHRDIKPENILVESHEPLNVKLPDFGLSKKIINDKARLQTFCGSVTYCAPEIYARYEQYKSGKGIKRRHSFMKTQPYQQSVDIWSFGAVLYHILCLCPPYEGTMATMLETIMTNEVDFGKLRTAGVSTEGIDFVSAMLKREPLARTTEAQCLQHPWLAQMAVSEPHDAETENETSPAAVEDQNEFQSSQLSQLSLTGTSKVSEIAGSDAETEFDDVADTHQLKPPKYNHEENLESQ
ncbi:hypothetical protein MMC29_001854 [Sticta canariensis]|nr:hypothetical protein [Sticta canariensis]